MAHTKRRVRQHIMEEQSYRLFRDLIPDEWAVHEYRPDYGIDLVVEIFKYIDEERERRTHYANCSLFNSSR